MRAGATSGKSQRQAPVAVNSCKSGWHGLTAKGLAGPGKRNEKGGSSRHITAATGTCRQGSCEALPASKAGRMGLRHGAAHPPPNNGTPVSAQALTMLIFWSCSIGIRTESGPAKARKEAEHLKAGQRQPEGMNSALRCSSSHVLRLGGGSRLMLSMTWKLSMQGVALQEGSAMCQTYRGRSAVRVGKGHDAGHSCRTRQPAWCRATDVWCA